MDELEELLEKDYEEKLTKDESGDESSASPKHRRHRSRSGSRERHRRRRSRSPRRHRRRSRSPRRRSRSPRRRSRSPRRRSRSPRRRSRSPRRRRSRSPRDAAVERQKQEDAELEREGRTVFAFSLPMDAKDRDIHEFFEEHAGKVKNVNLIMDRNSRRSKGFGYVEFVSEDTVPKSIALSGTNWRGYTIMVQNTQAEKNRAAAQAKALGTPVLIPGVPILPKQTAGPTRLYVGSLHFNITQEEVKKIFDPFGEIEFVNLHIDHETGRSKGFAFVQFTEAEAARTALAKVNGMEVAGRQLKVGLVNETSAAPAGALGELDDDEGGGLALNAQSRVVLMEKLQRSNSGTSPQVAQPTGSVSVAKPANNLAPTPCLVIENMFDSRALSDPDFENELKDDLNEEAKKFGNILHLHIAKEQFLVYMKYGNSTQAQAATTAFNGRWFDGKQLKVTPLTEADYYIKFPDSLGDQLTRLLLRGGHKG